LQQKTTRLSRGVSFRSEDPAKAPSGRERPSIDHSTEQENVDQLRQLLQLQKELDATEQQH
jgi:hypothetical protein